LKFHIWVPEDVSFLGCYNTYGKSVNCYKTFKGICCLLLQGQGVQECLGLTQVSKQTNKQTNKQTQRNKHMNKQILWKFWNIHVRYVVLY
jgi:hypothetical protein